MKIRTKVTYSLLAISLSTILLVSSISFYFAQNALIEANGKQLLAVASGQKDYITYILKTWNEEVSLVHSRPQLKRFLGEYLDSPNSDIEEKMSEALHESIEASDSIKKVEFYDLQGNLIVSKGHPIVARSLSKFLESEVIDEIKAIDLWMSDDGGFYALISSPLVRSDEMIGRCFTYMSAREVFDISQNYVGLGETSEIVLAKRTEGGHAQFLTPLRHDPNQNLNRVVSSDQIVRSDQTNVPMTYALRGGEATLVSSEIIDYRGKSVLAATAYIPEMDWGMVVKIDREEALRPIKALLFSIGGSALIICLFIVGIGMYVGRSVTRPILRFVAVVKKIGEGEMTQRVETLSGDEIGYLGGSFNEMLDSLNDKSRKLAESENRQRAVLDGMIDGLITINKRGEIESVNKSCERIFGYVEEEILGQNISILMPEPHRSQHDRYMGDYHNTGERKIIGIGRESEGMRKDGSIFPLELSVSEVEVQGQVIYSGIVRDISERKAAEEKIKQGNAELEEFSYRTSHDLRSPLVSSISLLEIAEDSLGAGDMDTAFESLGHVKKSLRKLEGLVRDILQLTRTKNADEKEEVIDLEALTDETLDRFGHLENFERLEFQKDFQFSATLYAKKSRVVLIIENLISNAIKYQDLGKEASFVKVSAFKKGESLVVTVADNGLGVPEGQRENLFKMFKRFHPKVSFGSGLGLYMMKKSADILGGELSYESVSDGSLFRLEIPLSSDVRERGSSD